MKQRTLLQKILIGIVALVIAGTIIGHLSDAHRRREGTLAIVHISGVIQMNATGPALMSADAEDIARTLHEYSEDKDIKAIVLRINSPGGTVGAVQEIQREMERCRANGKVIVASLGEVAASGGYYLAAASDRVVSNPGTITGSIGVILEFTNLEGLFQKIGFKLQVIKSGLHKDIGSPARSLTVEEKAMLQASIDDAYAQFFDVVRAGRRMSPEKLKAIADGRIFTGRQAKQEGLVDDLGDLQDAIQTAIQLAKLPAKPYTESDEGGNFSKWLTRAMSQMSRGPFESLQNVVAGASVDYLWRP